MTAFRFPAGRSFARSSASAASRAATSRSPFFVWNSSFVMSSAAWIAALCVSTIGPCDSPFFRAWSTYAATSRVYSGGRSERTVYSSPPIITLTACFFVLMGRSPGAPAPRTVALGLARLVLEERQAGGQPLHPLARCAHVLAQVAVFGLEIGHAAAGFSVEPRSGSAALAAALARLRFGFERARAPAGQLVRHLAEHGFQLVQRQRISPLAVVPQVRPPRPSPPPAPTSPLRPRAACGPAPGTPGATPRCASPP